MTISSSVGSSIENIFPAAQLGRNEFIVECELDAAEFILSDDKLPMMISEVVGVFSQYGKIRLQAAGRMRKYLGDDETVLKHALDQLMPKLTNKNVDPIVAVSAAFIERASEVESEAKLLRNQLEKGRRFVAEHAQSDKGSIAERLHAAAVEYRVALSDIMNEYQYILDKNDEDYDLRFVPLEVECYYVKHSGNCAQCFQTVSKTRPDEPDWDAKEQNGPMSEFNLQIDKLDFHRIDYDATCPSCGSSWTIFKSNFDYDGRFSEAFKEKTQRRQQEYSMRDDEGEDGEC
ncbi:hypothetical protein [Tateyamaria sp.]|uniref:hypothetical protein n=1 Tax=Tateyamaria sp. TaxID=1929288 RepID=UPI00329B639D